MSFSRHTVGDKSPSDRLCLLAGQPLIDAGRSMVSGKSLGRVVGKSSKWSVKLKRNDVRGDQSTSNIQQHTSSNLTSGEFGLPLLRNGRFSST